MPGNGEAEPCLRVVYRQWHHGQCPLRLSGVTMVSGQRESGIVFLQTGQQSECGWKVSSEEFSPAWKKSGTSQRFMPSSDHFLYFCLNLKFFIGNYMCEIEYSKGINGFIMKGQFLSKPSLPFPRRNYCASSLCILLPETACVCMRTNECV